MSRSQRDREYERNKRHLEQIRKELKGWEERFFHKNGRKPTSDDVKEARKEVQNLYLDYGKLRKKVKQERVLREQSSQPPPPPPTQQPPSAGLATALSQNAPVTPSKNVPTTTSSKYSDSPKRFRLPWETKNSDDKDTYESPQTLQQKRLFGNQITRDGHVGPTPQKTGRILGLFESFRPDTDDDGVDVNATPTRPATKGAPPGGASAHGTPSKSRVSASPADRFSTPRKRKHGSVYGSPLKKDIFETPQGLRRQTSHNFLESPQAFRPPPRPVRGLSAMVAELRQLEEHAFDEDEEAMREMENGGNDAPLPMSKLVKKPSLPGVTDAVGGEADKENEKEKEPESLVGVDGFDKVPELPTLPPGAYVDEHLVDENEGKEVFTRTWKKKGLKRQTRRVKMRPVTVKKSQPGAAADDEEEKEFDEASGDDDASDYETISKNDCSEIDEALASKPSKRVKKSANDSPSTQSKATTTNKDKGKGKAATKGKEPAVKKKITKKVSATAHSHMNFRKLNIKNKNSKAKGGGRFGRGRR